MTEDFYCDEVLSGKTKVNKVFRNRECISVSSHKTFLASPYSCNS